MKDRRFFKLWVFAKLRIFEKIFFFNAFWWHLTHKPPKNLTIDELYDIFYGSFLKVPPEDVEVVAKTDHSITLKSSHDCPFLRIALELDMDTREFCRNNSMRPCRYFMKKLGKQYVADNDYYKIRPHLPACEETLRIMEIE